MNKFIPVEHISSIIFLGLMICSIPSCAPSANEYFSQGSIALNNDQYKEAIDAFNKSIAKDSSNFVAYFERGVAKYSMKEYTGAIRDLDRAISLTTSKSQLNDLYGYRGMIKLSKGDTAAAYEDFDNAAKLGK